MNTARFCVLLGALALALRTHGQDITTATPPAGYFVLHARGASDSLMSLPLVRRSEFIGRVASVNSSSITVGDAAWTPDAYAPASGAVYYAQVVSGALKGLHYKVLGNTADTLVLDTKGDDLLLHPLGVVSAGSAGDLVRLRPYWTVGSIFGSDESELALAAVPSLAGWAYTEADQLLIHDNSVVGSEKPADTILAFVSGIGWRSASALGTDAAVAEICPGTAFTLRRQSISPVRVVLVGYISQEPVGAKIPALSGDEQADVFVSLAYPLPRSLALAGLDPIVTTSEGPDSAGDLLLDQTSARQGFRLPPELTTFRTAAGWRAGDLEAGDVQLAPGTGYLLRLRGGRAAAYWIQLPPK